jgi:hypothetical protein
MTGEISQINPEPLLPQNSQGFAINFKCPTLQELKEGTFHVAGKSAELLFRTMAAGTILGVGGMLAVGSGMALISGGWVVGCVLLLCAPPLGVICLTSPLLFAGYAITLAANCYSNFTFNGPVNFQIGQSGRG